MMAQSETSQCFTLIVKHNHAGLSHVIVPGGKMLPKLATRLEQAALTQDDWLLSQIGSEAYLLC